MVRFLNDYQSRQVNHNTANIYLVKVTIEALEKCKLCSKLTIKTSERSHWRRSDVFIVNFEHVSHFFVLFLLLTLNK